ncbi:hypothetical protein BGZ46_001879 [Entomortierella lignicola]|nr:hypothetical protein BGZ46_001879 [Entomortierella lignicola]
MSPNVPVDNPRPEVLIVGAGIRGLFLAILLKKINIPYRIFERASEVKPLGSAMSLNGCTFPALEQLGIYEELKKVSKHYPEVEFYNASSKKLGSFTTNDLKIAFKKKVLSTEEKEEKVIIHFSDNTSHSGDILVGADGAYSAVRQNMYKQMNAKGILPESDLGNFLINYITMVGVATPPDPEQYPQLKDENSRFNQIIFGDGANGTKSAGDSYKDFPCHLGGTMGDLFDATPKHLISKVFLEEKLFKTWHHGRSVLLGDACHKLHPAAGLGARNAIEDAISLANCLYFMKDSSEKSIESAFEDYYKHRYNHANEAFKTSNFTSKILNG